MDGIIFVDKPKGIKSHKVAEIIKKILNEKKAGHTGTLDPNATGLLILLIGKATRLASIFNIDKTYIGVGRLHKDINIKELRNVIKKNFIGKIKQLPPKRSNVKREWREREIYEFKILKKQNRDFYFKVRCEAGTYIRKLIHDVGCLIGGAHLIELRRIAIGKFKVTNALSIDEIKKLKEKSISKIEDVIKKIGKKNINLNKQQAKRFCNGAFINKEYLNKNEKNKFEKINENEKIFLWHKKDFLGVGIKLNNKIKPEIVIKQN